MHRDMLGNGEMAEKLPGIIDNHSDNNTDEVKDERRTPIADCLQQFNQTLNCPGIATI